MAGPLTKSVVGLDLGSYAIKAVELRQTLRGDIEIVKLCSVAAEPEKEVPLYQQVRDFVRTHALPTGHVVAAVAGDRISSRRLTFPFRDRRKIAQAVPFAVEDQVPFELEEIVVDWEVIRTDRSESEVTATIAPREEVSHCIETLRSAGIEPRTLEAEGLLLGNLAALFYLPSARLLLDLGHRKTTVCLTLEGRPVAARTLPIGGRSLSQALAKDYGIDLADAERIKCEEGVFRSGFESDSPRAVAVLDRLARELARTLGSLEPLLGGAAVSKLDQIAIFGGTAHLHRLDEYLAERTGIPTARLAFPPGPAGTALVAGGDPLLFGNATALALRATSRARSAIDLRKDEFALRVDYRNVGREFRWTGVLAAAALLLAIVSAGSSILQSSRRAEALEQEIRRLYSEALPGQPTPLDPVATLRAEVGKARDRADFLGIYSGNLSALDLLTQISSHVSPEVEVVFDEVSIDGQVARIRGYTKSFEAVDRLRTELARFPLFGSIQVSEIQNDSRRGGNTFKMTITLGEGTA